MKKWQFIFIAIVLLGVASFLVLNQKAQTAQVPEEKMTEVSTAQVAPISHASFVLHLGGQVIYNDPVGSAEAFSGQPTPNIILVSDIHGDHLNADTLKAVSTDTTTIVVPQAVKDELPEGILGEIIVLNNGETTTQKGIEIQAVPMYNIPESADSRHTKGRGNGYILSADGKRVYIAGDTGVTPEMKALQNIDIAFVPMNPPFTMTVEEAAEGVLSFKPKVVHPYHYRSSDGLQDVNKFKELVESEDSNITVELLNFYPDKK